MMSFRKAFTRVVLVGDSLTQRSFSPGGWGARLADHFQRRADIVNRGFSGYNTEWMKLILPELIPGKGAADIVTILLGSNDSALPDVNPQQHVPLSSYASNLVEMCSYVETIGVPKPSIILITPPPLSEKLWKQTCKEKYGYALDHLNTVVKEYAQAALQAGRDCDVTTLDLHTAMSESGHLQDYLSDGLHFTAAGNEFLARLLIPTVEGLLGIPEGETVYPEWCDVDWSCPRSTFSKV